MHLGKHVHSEGGIVSLSIGCIYVRGWIRSDMINMTFIEYRTQVSLHSHIRHPAPPPSWLIPSAGVDLLDRGRQAVQSEKEWNSTTVCQSCHSRTGEEQGRRKGMHLPTPSKAQFQEYIKPCQLLLDELSSPFAKEPSASQAGKTSTSKSA